MSPGPDRSRAVEVATAPVRTLLTASVTGAARLGRRLLNGIRCTTGIDPPVVGATPRALVGASDWTRLWRYDGVHRAQKTPLLVVHSLVSRSHILDLRPGHTFVGHLLDAGFDVFLLEWEEPDEWASRRTLVDYVDDDLPTAIDEVRQLSGAPDVTLVGYCFGGILALLAAARDAEGRIGSLVTMATAVDFDELGVVTNILGRGRIDPRKLLDEDGNLPATTVARGIRLLRPTADVRALATLWQNLDDDERVEALRSVHDWLGDQVAFPGALFVECVEALVHDNALVNGCLTIADEPVDLGSVTCPYLSVVADEDFVVPAAAALPAVDLVGSDDATTLRLPSGHIAFVASATRLGEFGPLVVDWLRDHGEPVGPVLT